MAVLHETCLAMEHPTVQGTECGTRHLRPKVIRPSTDNRVEARKERIEGQVETLPPNASELFLDRNDHFIEAHLWRSRSLLPRHSLYQLRIFDNPVLTINQV